MFARVPGRRVFRRPGHRGIAAAAGKVAVQAVQPGSLGAAELGKLRKPRTVVERLWNGCGTDGEGHWMAGATWCPLVLRCFNKGGFIMYLTCIQLIHITSQCSYELLNRG